MKLLVIPDIHNEIRLVDRICEAETPDHVVCLGDYFDSFDESPEMTKRTALWVKQRLHDNKWTLLWGNHELPYRFHDLACSGFTPAKKEIIGKILQREDWNRMSAWKQVGPFTISHAGFMETWAHPVRGFDKKWMQEHHEETVGYVEKEVCPPLLYCCTSWRGGNNMAPGILWCDWREFRPVPGLHQIVGHTVGQYPRMKVASGSYNLCIDTNLSHYLAINMETNELKIRSTRATIEEETEEIVYVVNEYRTSEYLGEQAGRGTDSEAESYLVPAWKVEQRFSLVQDQERGEESALARPRP